MAVPFFGAFGLNRLPTQIAAALPGIWAAILLSGPLSAAEPAAGSVTGARVSESNVPLVASLVRDLGADDYLQRMRADEQLAKLGTAARAELEVAATDASPEVRLRAKELLKQINVEALWQSAPFTYEASGKPGSQTLEALAKQSGNRLLLGDQYGNFDDKPLEMKYAGGEFWAVLDDVCRRTGNKLRPHYDTREPGLVVTAGEPGNFPTAYTGPIRSQIISARRAYSEEIDYEAVRSDKSHTFQINLQMMWEDRFRLIAYRAQPELVLARTNAGTDIASTQPSTTGWNVAGGGTRQLTMNLRLHPPTTTATKLDTLSLKWGLIAVGDMATLDVSDLSSRGPAYQDDVELRIETMEQGPGQRVELHLAVVRDLVLSDPQEAFFQECDVELLDLTGTPYRKQGQTNSFESDAARMKLTFVGETNESRPQRLRFTYPRIRSQRDVVITFRDVPLPTGRPD